MITLPISEPLARHLTAHPDFRAVWVPEPRICHDSITGMWHYNGDRHVLWHEDAEPPHSENLAYPFGPPGSEVSFVWWGKRGQNQPIGHRFSLERTIAFSRLMLASDVTEEEARDMGFEYDPKRKLYAGLPQFRALCERVCPDTKWGWLGSVAR